MSTFDENAILLKKPPMSESPPKNSFLLVSPRTYPRINGSGDKLFSSLPHDAAKSYTRKVYLWKLLVLKVSC